MKTITQILNEMILKNEKKIEMLEKNWKETNQRILDDEVLWRKELNIHANNETKIIREIIKKVKKITLILSIAIILNSIAIIILNLWR